MSVYVDTLDTDLPLRGITRDVIRVKVEGRLRQAGIPVVRRAVDAPVPGDPVLYVNVTTIFDDANMECVCALRMELMQTVRLFRNPGYVVFNVPTWSVGGVGVYTKRWREEMVSDVLAFTDEFIDAFYRANSVVGR